VFRRKNGRIDGPVVTYFSERLVKKLSVILKTPLTVVEAPMGYGKTTAVKEFLKKYKAPVIWVPVSNFSSGSTNSSFWRSLCKDLNTALPGQQNVIYSLEKLGYPSDPVHLEEAKELFLKLTFKDPTILVVDDYHLLPNQFFGQLVEALAAETGAVTKGLHIVLLSRHVYPGAKELLELKSQLSTIGRQTFVFKAEDVLNYFATNGLEISHSQAQSLCLATDGWISGLYIYLMRQRKQGSFTVPEQIAYARYNHILDGLHEEELLPELAALLEKEIYSPLSNEAKELLLALSPLERFTVHQADFIYGLNTRNLLKELTHLNSFIDQDAGTGVYSMHTIFRRLLVRLYSELEAPLRKAIAIKCGDWFTESGEFVSAMQMYRQAGDFEKALTVMERDLSNNLVTGEAAFFAEMFRHCPEELLDRHPGAAFKHAIAALSACDYDGFTTRCEKLKALCNLMPKNDPATRVWCGELELLLALTEYNDIAAMSIRHRRAWELMRRPTSIYPAHSTWTMGCPSVLFMFHRRIGELASELNLMRESMPHYYRVTAYHGAGAEKLFESEALYYTADFTGASVGCHGAEIVAKEYGQTGNLICAIFLRMRLATAKNDLRVAWDCLDEMKHVVSESGDYYLLNTVGLCVGWFHALMGRADRIPTWIGAGANSSTDNKMYSFAKGNWYIVHGLALLLDGRYEKTAGLFGSLIESKIFDNNLMFIIYGHLYLSCAHHGMGDNKALAMKELRIALDAALPDQLIMPFIELHRHILPVLKALRCDRRSKDVRRILTIIERQLEGVVGTEPQLYNGMSPQDLRLLDRVRAGMSFKETAFDLGLSYGTVRNRFADLYRRFGVDGIEELLEKMKEGEEQRKQRTK
jgi:LuxR family maltose regulon positive regulatory protein